MRITRENKKSPSGIGPHLCSPSPQVAKYITVTQDTRPSGVAEVCNEYLFGQGKTGGLGQVTVNKNEKWVLLDPGRPDGGVKKIIKNCSRRGLNRDLRITSAPSAVAASTAYKYDALTDCATGAG